MNIGGSTIHIQLTWRIRRSEVSIRLQHWTRLIRYTDIRSLPLQKTDVTILSGKLGVKEWGHKKLWNVEHVPTYIVLSILVQPQHPLLSAERTMSPSPFLAYLKRVCVWSMNYRFIPFMLSPHAKPTSLPQEDGGARRDCQRDCLEGRSEI